MSDLAHQLECSLCDMTTPRWTTMGEIAEVVGGGTPRTSEPSNFENGDVPWLTPADLSGFDGMYVSRGARNITQKGLTSSAARLLPAGTVLFTSRAPIGYVAIARTPLATNQGFKSFVLKVGVLPEYVYWWLKGSKQRAEELASGTTFLEISGANARKLPVPIVPLERQRAIVAEIEKQFSRLDEAVASLERAKANLARYKAAILKAAVEGRLVPTEASLSRLSGQPFESGTALLACALSDRKSAWRGPGKYKEPAEVDLQAHRDVPEGWVLASADMVGDILLGRQRAPQYLTGKHFKRYLRVANIKDDRVDFSDLEEMDFDPTHFAKYRLSLGDILVSEGQSPELLGQSAIFPGFSEPLCFQKTLHRFRASEAATSSAFAQIVFRSNVASGVFRKLGSITTNIGHLTLEKFKASPFPLPPLAEQRRIVTEVDRLMSIARTTEAQLDTALARAARLRQSILSRAFSGTAV